MEYSKDFVTSVVLGKDLVPRYLLYSVTYAGVDFTLLQYYHIDRDLLLVFCRLGLSQLEGFRRHLLEVLQKSNKPKVT